MIPEHERLQACLRDLHAQRKRGPNKPMPPKEGPAWRAFVAWFKSADLGGNARRSDVWRAFSAGFGSKKKSLQKQ